MQIVFRITLYVKVDRNLFSVSKLIISRWILALKSIYFETMEAIKTTARSGTVKSAAFHKIIWRIFSGTSTTSTRTTNGFYDNIFNYITSLLSGGRLTLM